MNKELKKFYKVVDNSDNYYGSIDLSIQEIELLKDSELEYNVFKTKKKAQNYLDRLYYHRLTD